MATYSDLYSLTLGDAINIVRKSEDPKGTTTTGMSSDSAKAFDMHDSVHILFECDTTIKGEIEAHIWMAFATTAKISEMHKAVANQEHRSILKNIGHGSLLATWFVMLPKIAYIIWKANRMISKLPYENLDNLKLLPVFEIRKKFGIS